MGINACGTFNFYFPKSLQALGIIHSSNGTFVTNVPSVKSPGNCCTAPNISINYLVELFQINVANS